MFASISYNSIIVAQPNAMPSNSINNFSMETIIQINSQDNPYEDEDEEIKENPQ